MKHRIPTALFPRPLLALLLAALVALTGCDGADDTATRRDAPLLANLGLGGKSSGARSQSLGGRLNGPAPERRVLGTDDFIEDLDRQGKDLVNVSDDGAFTLNLVDVPIPQAARAVLADALQKTYTIKPGVEGTVTLQTTRPLSERDLLDTFQTVLELNGATMQREGNVITIVPSQGAARRITGIDNLGGIGARVVAVPLQYSHQSRAARSNCNPSPSATFC